MTDAPHGSLVIQLSPAVTRYLDALAVDATSEAHRSQLGTNDRITIEMVAAQLLEELIQELIDQEAAAAPLGTLTASSAKAHR